MNDEQRIEFLQKELDYLTESLDSAEDSSDRDAIEGSIASTRMLLSALEKAAEMDAHMKAKVEAHADKAIEVLVASGMDATHDIWWDDSGYEVSIDIKVAGTDDHLPYFVTVEGENQTDDEWNVYSKMGMVAETMMLTGEFMVASSAALHIIEILARQTALLHAAIQATLDTGGMV